MASETLQDRLVEELKDIYSAEKQLTKALPKLAKASEEEALAEAFRSHLLETQEHVNRLDQVFEMLEASSRGKKCEGMEGLIKEGSETIEDENEDLLRDIGMISAAQRVEHYEIAAYRAVIRHCEHLNLDDARELLEQTLQEEEAADEKLGSICEELCTRAASMGSEGEEGGEEGMQEDERPQVRMGPKKVARARS
jgi:ferritin-like metal-binding protein YciE